MCVCIARLRPIFVTDPISTNTENFEMSRFRRQVGANSALARHVRATPGQAGRRAVVGRPRACARRKDEQSKARSGAGPNFDSCRIRNPSAKTSGRSTATGRACGRGLMRWTHRWNTRRTDCRLISARTAAMVALRQPGNRRKSKIFAVENSAKPCYIYI